MCPSGTTYVKRKRLSLFIIELITIALVSDNMTRKKGHLTKYVRRRNFAYRATLSGVSRVKRSREIASLQSPYKSPYKSPHSQASPARKKVKSDNNHQSKSQSKSPFRPSPLRERKVHGNVWFKSPLRSPFRVVKKQSSAQKKSKSARSLFGQGEEQNSEATLLETKCNDDVWELTEMCTDASDDSDTKSVSDTESPHSAENNTSVTLESDNSILEKMIELLPTVMKTLSTDGKDEQMLQFFELVSENKFPLTNIAYLLWNEVVKWFSCTSTTQMRYSDQTKTFWKLGWRIFGTRFVNFMGGYKSHGDAVLKMTEIGNYSPESSEINFAVPALNQLRDFDPYGVEGERKPGIYQDIIDMLSMNLTKKSACLTFDGKKIKQALTRDTGDVDLLGFEKNVSLKDKQTALENKLTEIRKLKEKITQDIDCDITKYKSEAIGVLQKALTVISNDVSEIQKLRIRKEYCKTKLMERGGKTDWRTSKYSYAISAVIAFIYEIDQYVKKAGSVTDDICRYIAFLNESLYVIDNNVNINDDDRYIPIDQQIGPEGSSRFLKQKSNEWFSLRELARITGSTIHKAVGCDGLSKQKDHFEKVICGIPENEPSEEIKAAMEHGVINEINAVATVVGKIIPVVEPTLKFCEEGCVPIEQSDGSVFMVVSPDGSLRQDSSLDTTEVAVEIKCPVKQVHIEFPPRYLLQCLSEIQVLDARYLLFVSWTEDCTTVFKVERNDNLLTKAMSVAVSIYGQEKPKKPTKLTPDVKDLKEDIIQVSKTVQMIGRFKSCKTSSSVNIYDTRPGTASVLIELLTHITECLEEQYELNREKASEAVVFLVADLDRSWERNTIRCGPVAWFPKGYSLDAGTMRIIAETIHTTCHNGGIHIPCESFDGQWHLLAVRSADNKPLTLYQLQKDLWKVVEDMSKKEIVDELKSLNKTVICSLSDTEETGIITRTVWNASNGAIKLPQYRYVQRSVEQKQTTENEDVLPEITLADTITDRVRELIDVDEKVLAMSSVSDELEREAISNNVREEDWSNELGRLNDEQDPEMVQEQVHLDTESSAVEERSSATEITIKDADCILALFKTTKDCNKKGKWNDVTGLQLQTKLATTDGLKELLDIELRVLLRYMKKTKGLKGANESEPKAIKLNKIEAFLKLEKRESKTPKGVTRIRKVKSVIPLSEIAEKAVLKYSKQELNVILAEYKWDDMYKSWVEEINGLTLNDVQCEWFYKPEFSSSRKQYEVKCIDSTHLLTRTRRKTCKGGIEGLSNESWLKVAKQKNTLLTPIMVEEVTDPMSVSMAKTHFSESVEHEMRLNGYTDAAGLCHDIRSWWESEDDPGISSSTRIVMRQALRRRLMSKIDFKR